MDPSFFHKPWIEKLLSTFDPQPVSLPSERQESLVCQVISVKVITGLSDAVELAGRAELHDNHLYVNAVFTKDAAQRFEEEEGEEGCSGAELGDLKNSIVALKKYHVIPRLKEDQTRSDLLVCVEYFTLTHFDALPRLSRHPLVFACNKKAVATNILRLCRQKNEVHSEPEQHSVMGSADSFSSPHLTQLLEEINKASQEENTPPRRTFVFEITVPRLTPTDSGSSNGSGEGIQTLNRALDKMERKLTIAKSLHHILEAKGGQGSQDSQMFYDAPKFHVRELPPEYHKGLMEDFDEGDFEVPPEVLKQLETIPEWRPDYVQPSSTPSGKGSAEIIEMGGGGLSSTPVEKRTNNKQTSEEAATSQAQSEVMMSVDSDDWSMHSVESIGLSTEERLLADTQPDVQPVVQHAASKHTKKACQNKSTRLEESQPKAPQNSAPLKRKRIPTSEGTPDKIPRQKSPELKNDGQSNEKHSVFETREALSPIPNSSQSNSQSSRFLQIRSRLIQKQCMDSNDSIVLHSTPIESIDGGVVNEGAAVNTSALQSDAKMPDGDHRPDDKSGPDLFESAQERSSYSSEQIQPEEEPCQSNLNESEVSHAPSAKKKQQKTVQFDDSARDDQHLTKLNDKQDSSSNRSSNKTSNKPQNKESKTSEHSEDDDDSVEILNTSAGFQPSEFYSSPTSQGTSAVRKKHRPVAKLRSPQIPFSIPTPINSLPSHQPRHSRSFLPVSSQSGVSSSNCTFEREVDPSIEQLSNIKLEDELLQWCAGHFMDMLEA